jgi:hypothetical protein
VDLLRDSFYALQRQASPGIDGVTWQEYETGLEDRLIDLHSRVHRGVYRAQPSRRVYIPKADGRQRPLGIAALEDKLVQQAVVTILNQIYEVDFKGFSYGFRPGRSPHQALDPLTVGIQRKRVNWVLDADIRGFFDNLSHEWTMRFIEHRVADRRILRLIQKWLKAGTDDLFLGLHAVLHPQSERKFSSRVAYGKVTIATVADAITGPNAADAACVGPGTGEHPQSNAPRPLCVLRHCREHPSIATGPSGRRTLLAHHAQQSELEGAGLVEAIPTDQGPISISATKAVSPLRGVASYRRAVKHF